MCGGCGAVCVVRCVVGLGARCHNLLACSWHAAGMRLAAARGVDGGWRMAWWVQCTEPSGGSDGSEARVSCFLLSSAAVR